MPKIKLPEKCGWFYILQLRHNGIWGFGITSSKNIKNYLQKRYINPGANKNQVFDNLYYGKLSQIRALETHLKNEWGDKLLILFTDKLEWFDPETKIDGDQIINFVESRCKANYSEIYKVKTEYLPFSPSNILKNIADDPDKYLEDI
jgi:hypothetical protein